MTPQEILIQRNKMFDEKVNKLRRADPKTEEVVYFGFATMRGNEIFRTADFGNIKKFHNKTVRKVLRSLLETLQKQDPDTYMFHATYQTAYHCGRKKVLADLHYLLQDILYRD